MLSQVEETGDCCGLIIAKQEAPSWRVAWHGSYDLNKDMLQIMERDKQTHFSVYVHFSPQCEQLRNVVEVRKQGDSGNNVGEKEEMRRGGGNFRRSFLLRRPSLGPGSGSRTLYGSPLPSANVVSSSHSHTWDQQRSAVSLLTGCAILSLGSSHDQRQLPQSVVVVERDRDESAITERIAPADELFTNALNKVQDLLQQTTVL